MLRIFLVLLFSYIIADFYFQGNLRSDAKTRLLRTLPAHGALYALTVGIPLLAIGFWPWWLSLSVALGLGLFHLLTDMLTERISRKRHHESKTELLLFLADQAVHILFLAALSLLLKPFLVWPSWLSGTLYADQYRLIFKFVMASLICGRPAGVLIRRMLECHENACRSSENEEVGESEASEKVSDGGGMIIGILEREVILLLTFLQQYGAIGFVLTAKSVARYKQLEKRAFAEKYLIGTLMSALISLLVGVLMSAL